MSSSRREFLAIGLAAAVLPEEQPPGSPPAFGTAPSVGPEVGPATFAEAEKLVQVQYTPKERAVAAGNWRESMAALYERRTGPRQIAVEEAPASRWIPGRTQPARHPLVRSAA